MRVIAKSQPTAGNFSVLKKTPLKMASFLLLSTQKMVILVDRKTGKLTDFVTVVFYCFFGFYRN